MKLLLVKVGISRGASSLSTHPRGHKRLRNRTGFLGLFLTAWFCAWIVFLMPAHAQILFGSVQGVVHDPQGRAIPGATVDLKAQNSYWEQKQQTNADGEFKFGAVPLGQYIVTVTFPNFQTQEQSVVVESGTSPNLHFQLALATVSSKTVVSGAPVVAATQSVTPTTLLSREAIQLTPGADRTNSLQMITDYVPGSYVTHDQLHIRGGHQVSWLIDGVPIPNTNIASNVGPQIDPKDIDYLEILRGSYNPDYGDRTYGVFNIEPRTGFELDNQCDLLVGFGNYYQTNDNLGCGGHTQKFAYYGSLNGNRSNLGLQPPTPQILHDAENGFGGFGTIIYNPDTNDQLRLVVSSRRDYYQIPTANGDINEVFGTPGAIYLTPPTTFLSDAEQESDTFVTFSWVRTITPNTLLTVSPLFHYNSANYTSNPNDFPTATTNERGSTYVGGQATISGTIAHNSLTAGIYGFWQHDNQLFAVLFNDGSAPNFSDRELANGSLTDVWVNDKFKATSWLTLSAGVRQSHFSGEVVENATSPRAGVSIRVPKINWVFHGFYGHYYQAPPLLTFAGPALGNAATSQGYSFSSLFGERDEEHQFGVTIPLKRWSVDADTFVTRADNFFDHNNLGESNIFIPVTLTEALIRGWEVTVRSPKIWGRGQVHLAYSNQIAEVRGNITGGLIPVPNPISPDYSPLDHDQRNTLNIGGEFTLPWSSFVSGDLYYGSGFWNGNGPTALGLTDCCTALDYLPQHTTFDLTLGKDFGEGLRASITALNVTNRRVELDNSFTFGGFHWNNPREIYVQLRWRFHY